MWKRESGTITDAQKTGREIIGYNIPLTNCAGDDVIDAGLPDEKQITYVYGESEESEIMGWLCGVNPAAFKIEDGILHVKNFCGEWVEIGGLTSPEDESPNPFPFPDTPTIPASACGKANEIINAAAEVMAVAVEYFDDESEFYGQVYGAYQKNGVTPGKADIYLLQLDMNALISFVSGGTVTDPDMVQAMKCKAAKGMDDTTVTATDADVEWLYSSVRSACYDYLIDTISAELMWTAWEQLLQTMGENDRKMLISRGSQNFAADCSCPDEDGTELWPTEEDWYIAYSFQGTHPSYWTLGTDNGITVITQRGAELETNTTGSDKVNLSWSPPVSTGTITRVKVEMLINDTLVTSMWTGLGWQVAGGGNYLQGELVGTNGIYVYLNESVSVNPASFYVTAEVNADSNYDPMAVVIARIILAGSGDHPLGL